MAKKNVVKFSASDAPKPKYLASGLIGFSSPLPFVVQAGKTHSVDLGMSCSCALMLPTGLVAPGENIVVKIENTTNKSVQYDTTEIIARAYPLFNVDYEIA